MAYNPASYAVGTLTDNLIQREEDAHFNAQLWMAPCISLNLETLQAIGAGEVIEALILEIDDYQGPTALLRDTAAWLAGRREWRKAFRPVLDAAGYAPLRKDRVRHPASRQSGNSGADPTLAGASYRMAIPGAYRLLP